MTTLESTPREAPETAAIPAEDGLGIAVAPLMARALPLVTARLRQRHPAVAPEVVERHVHVAAVRLTREARIHDYLPILIERTAAESLRRSCG